MNYLKPPRGAPSSSSFHGYIQVVDSVPFERPSTSDSYINHHCRCKVLGKPMITIYSGGALPFASQSPNDSCLRLWPDS